MGFAMGRVFRTYSEAVASALARNTRWIAALALAFAVCSAKVWADPPLAAPRASAKPPIVFAAASLQPALDEVAAAWKDSTGKQAIISYGSSAILAKQIEQGAPADIFISADLKWMDYLDKAKLLAPGTRKNRFANKLVLIEPATFATALEIARGFDLAGAAAGGKIAVCAIESCPAGIYAKEALESLGVLASVKANLVQTENVRGALALVSRGEARFGIVYATDAKSDPRVRSVGTFPESSHSPILYPVALLASSSNEDAGFFLAFLTSQAATRIFLDHGFEILPK